MSTHRPPTHPGEMLVEEFLKPLGISQATFAIRLGVSISCLNAIVRGKRSVTADTALRLERVLGMPADFWLGLQQDWDLWHALRGEGAAAIDGLEPLRLVGSLDRKLIKLTSSRKTNRGTTETSGEQYKCSKLIPLSRF